LVVSEINENILLYTNGQFLSGLMTAQAVNLLPFCVDLYGFISR
jgi:hypothetical protein